VQSARCRKNAVTEPNALGQRIFVMNTRALTMAGLLGAVLSMSGAAQTKLAPEFQPSGAWVGSKPLSIKDLRGQVAIINIWVHSCINCHNSLPTLKAWYAKYKTQGLEIIGVHTPEFQSDKDLQGMKNALRRDGVTWPVFQDNEEKTWKAYNNRYWPAFYLVDKKGVIREVHAGEISDRYPNAIPGLEKTIQALLLEK
jgi:thiol-disulfide isomerase/thioredoxin